MTTRIKLRRDTATNWTSANVVLALGEPGLESDTRKVKYGDGTTAWTQLAYSAAGVDIGQDGQIAIGDGAGIESSINSIAIGTDAGVGQSWVAIAIGHNAGNDGQGGQSIAIGRSAGEESQDMNAIAIGRFAGSYQQGTESIAIGRYAGSDGQGQHSIAIGSAAGEQNQDWAAIAIGEDAGTLNQNFRAIAIGRWAGEENQNQHAIAIGALAGRFNQNDFSIAIGRHAGEDSQGTNAIAIGNRAGCGSTDPTVEGPSTANWASGGLSGNTTVVLDTTQNIYPGMTISGAGITDITYVVGVDGTTNTITLDTVTNANAEGTYYFSGTQGDYSIAIGYRAGDVIQHDNSIVLNATGGTLVSAADDSFVVKPIRSGATSIALNYNTGTGEVTYSTGTIKTVGNITGTQDIVYPTAINLTNTISKLSDNYTSFYTLDNGVEGQIIYLVPQNGATIANVKVVVGNARILNSGGATTAQTYTNIDYWPFDPSSGTPISNIATLIFTDGAWQASSGSFD